MKPNLSVAPFLIVMFSCLAWAYQPSSPASAPSDALPGEIEGVDVTERLGQKLDMSLELTNEEGQTMALGQYFGHGRPVIMAMVYYNCPSLCNFQLNGLVDVVKKMKGQAGVDYDLVAVSMDHTENPEMAKKKKANYMKALGQPGAENGWHFLVASESNVKKLASDLGFRFKWDESQKQFAHAAATYVVTPSGTVSRYLYGIEFAPQTLRLSLVEASEGKIGNIIEQLTLFCFQFNPAKNRYTLYAFNLMRIGAALTVLIIAIFLVPVWLRERQRKTARV